jgi:YtkA-like
MTTSIGKTARLGLLCAVLAVAASSACSSSSDAKVKPDSGAAQQADAGSLPEELSCQSDSRVSPYALPLTLLGPLGYGVTLRARAPNPSAKGLNQWTVTVTDSSGAPLPGARLVLATTMPDHGHSSAAPTAPATDETGSASIPGLNFFMAGVWRIQIDVYPVGAGSDANPTDSVAFLFCVEG